MRGLMGGLYAVSEWIMRFAVTNILWLFFNFPIVLIGLNALYAEQPGSGVFALIVFSVLAPFLFFPSTAAMFSSARDWILHREGSSLIRSFWKYYKDNYKNSMLGGLLLTVLWIVWAVDYNYLSNVNIIFMFAFFIMGVILFVYTINFFSVMAHYHMKVRMILKNSLLITLGSPLLFLTIAIGSGMILYVSINGPMFLIPFFTGSLIAFISFSAFYRLYLKLTQGADKQK
ncbi:YesL family protein [Sediminibacillus massiliensis]|uniref:YesL family protein n=1 Tax=Sediminibacillus massiliensis TaxID=1926277 RepID=UPI0009883A26|nr:DUF624 domain-containing protein [Sediminibacillus massiliensis]